MSLTPKSPVKTIINNFDEFVQLADYSLLEKLNCDPDARGEGNDHSPREVYSGHYVPVTPTPLPDPEYVTHSTTFFKDLGFHDDLVQNQEFSRIFSGDITAARPPMRQVGWATGYALSIYGTEYTQQCPFGTGNGYGDGRAISVFEGLVNGQRWEMQLKGGGRTPYCRGADGRAVLRSSVREFLAQEHMHALRVPTTRSLTLYTSKSETVTRPWYSQNSHSTNPDILVDNPVAITTRVAPSFLRVGQLELFARRARNSNDPQTFEELQKIAAHLIEREYKNEIDQSLSFSEQLVVLAKAFRQRLISLVVNWIRVGYCQGNFNSDNCAAGGFTLDYGPFGFCEVFDPEYQPWTGGGKHFSFFNQPVAAEANYHMFWTALRPLIEKDSDSLELFDDVRRGFSAEMQVQIQNMWAAKLGLTEYSSELVKELIVLMTSSEIDYTIFFRELSHIPENMKVLNKCFYVTPPKELQEKWEAWLDLWRSALSNELELTAISEKMKQTNPKYTWREWFIVPAYREAEKGNYTLIRELQAVLNRPYDEQTKEVEEKYYQLRPKEFFYSGGVSHYSCSS